MTVLVFQRGMVPVSLLEPADLKMAKGKKKNVSVLMRGHGNVSMATPQG